MRNLKYRGWRWLALATVGTTFFLNGCDPTIQTTVENGIITLSQSLLASIFRAITALVNEKNAQTTAGLLSDLHSMFA